VVLDALQCLQEQELEDLMAEGYESLPAQDELLDGADAFDRRSARPAW